MKDINFAQNKQDVYPEFDNVVKFFKEKYPGKGTGIYSRWDWQRLLAAYKLVCGKLVLDVGIGIGAFSNILVQSQRFERVVGIDIKKNSRLILPQEGLYEFYIMSILDLKFKNQEFDTVVCMEVLEHLEPNDFIPALEELRRVTKKRLIVTVPFYEPEPLWHFDRRGGHRQRFDYEKLSSFFPNAVATILNRGKGIEWIVLLEDDKIPKPEGFSILNYRYLTTLVKQSVK